MACQKKGLGKGDIKKAAPKKGKFKAFSVVVLLFAMCIPAFSAVPLTYLMGLKADSIAISGGGSFAGHVAFDWFSADTFSGTVTTTGKLVVGDSLRVNKTTKLIGEVTCSLGVNAADFRASDSVKAVSIAASGNVSAVKVIASDSIQAATFTSSGNAYFGSSTKFVKFSASGYYIGNDADTVYNRVSADTFYLNTQIAGAISTKNVRLDGPLYLPNTVTADSIDVESIIIDHAAAETLDVTGWGQADYWTVDTFAFGGDIRTDWPDTTGYAINWLGSASKADTTGRPACAFGNTKGAGGDDTIDTLVNTLIEPTSIILLTPRFAATAPVYIVGQAQDSVFIGYAAADSTGSRVYGIDFWIKE